MRRRRPHDADVVGFIARALVPGRDDIGVLRTIALGVAGSVLGGFVFGLLTVGFRGFQPAGWIGSIIGAVVVLLLYDSGVMFEVAVAERLIDHTRQCYAAARRIETDHSIRQLSTLRPHDGTGR